MGLRLVYVEDDEVNRLIMEHLLGGTDHELLMFPDAGTTLSCAQLKEIDLFVLDINLGRGNPDGVELMHRLREICSEAAFWTLTAYAAESDEARFLQVGFDAYYPKPLDHGRFLASLRSLRDKKQKLL